MKRRGCAYLAGMTLRSIVRDTIEVHSLIDPGQSVLVALSGGPDSVALLHLLISLRDDLNLRLGAVHVNHRIRKREAQRDEKFCEALCEKLEIDLTIATEDIPARAKRLKQGIEETGREFRYDFFSFLADEDDYDRIALGHHADDQVETILFRLLRGSGRTGLLGMPVRRDQIVRPLLEVPKTDLLEYLKSHDLDYCLDSSNANLDYRRNYLRQKLLPMIREEINPAVDRALLSLRERLADEEAYFERQAARSGKRLVSRTPGGKIELARSGWSRYDNALRRRVLRHLLADLAGGDWPDRESLERLDDFCLKPGKRISLPQGIDATALPDRIVLHRRAKLTFAEPVPVETVSSLRCPALQIVVREVPKGRAGPVKSEDRFRVQLDASRVEPPLVIRSVKPGDRFRPLGLKGVKKVGNFLTDRKLPPVYRDEIPVLCDRKGIIWLVGCEIADRVKRTSRTKRVLSIDVDIKKGFRSPTG